MEEVIYNGQIGNKVGSSSADLFLQTLGKVYIQTGSSAKLLDDVIKSVANIESKSDAQAKTTIVKSYQEMMGLELEDGLFVFCQDNAILYMSYKGAFIALVDTAAAKGNYVKKTGDTMTGALEIYSSDAPLIVASTALCRNLNVEYLGGLASEAYAVKRKNEIINGNWVFKGKGESQNTWRFVDNVKFESDIVSAGSLGTPVFTSGFAGSGWRLDGTKNMLTVDYLVVRKAMQVYEMVINQIQATNGSLWVSNSSTVETSNTVKMLTPEFFEKLFEYTEANTKTRSDIIKNSFEKGQWYCYVDLYDRTKDGSWYASSGVTQRGTERGWVNKVEIGAHGEKYNTGDKRVCIDLQYVILIKDPDALCNYNYIKLLKHPEILTLGVDEALYALDVTPDYSEFEAFAKGFELYRIGYNRQQNNTEGLENYKTRNSWTFKEALQRSAHYLEIPNGVYGDTGMTYVQHYEQNGPTPKDSELPNVYQVYPFYKYFCPITEQLISWYNDSYSVTNTTPSGGTASGIVRAKGYVPCLYVVDTDKDQYPLFRAGDILRCQKYQDGNMKYYDALVANATASRQFLIYTARSVFDIYTEIHYNDDGSLDKSKTKEEYNTGLYDRTTTYFDPKIGEEKVHQDAKNGGEYTDQDWATLASNDTDFTFVGDIEAKDDMVQIGSIQDKNRQGAVYLTSCDDGGPFVDVLSGVNRPDYSVIIHSPLFMTTTITDKKTGKRTDTYVVKAGEQADSEDIVEIKELIEGDVTLTIEDNILQAPDMSVGVFLQSPGDSNSLVLTTENDEILIWEDAYTDIVIVPIGQPTLECVPLTEEVKGVTYYKTTYTKTTKVRLGNLDGVYDDIFGKNQPHGYGLYGENVYLTGEFYLNNGKSVASFKDDITLAVQNVKGQLEEDLVKINALLASTGTGLLDKWNSLETAGLHIKDNKLLLWGNSLMIATTSDELEGKTQPTALFTDGQINAKLLNVEDLYASRLLSTAKDNYGYVLQDKDGNEVINKLVTIYPDPDKPYNISVWQVSEPIFSSGSYTFDYITLDQLLEENPTPTSYTGRMGNDSDVYNTNRFTEKQYKLLPFSLKAKEPIRTDKNYTQLNGEDGVLYTNDVYMGGTLNMHESTKYRNNPTTSLCIKTESNNQQIRAGYINSNIQYTGFNISTDNKSLGNEWKIKTLPVKSDTTTGSVYRRYKKDQVTKQHTYLYISRLGFDNPYSSEMGIIPANTYITFNIPEKQTFVAPGYPTFDTEWITHDETYGIMLGPVYKAYNNLRLPSIEDDLSVLSDPRWNIFWNSTSIYVKEDTAVCFIIKAETTDYKEYDDPFSLSYGRQNLIMKDRVVEKSRECNSYFERRGVLNSSNNAFEYRQSPYSGISVIDDIYTLSSGPNALQVKPYDIQYKLEGQTFDIPYIIYSENVTNQKPAGFDNDDVKSKTREIELGTFNYYKQGIFTVSVNGRVIKTLEGNRREESSLDGKYSVRLLQVIESPVNGIQTKVSLRIQEELLEDIEGYQELYAQIVVMGTIQHLA